MVPPITFISFRGADDFQIGPWVGMLETSSRKQIALTRTVRIWQRGLFDHVLRNDESQKWNYVRDNPVRAGLVTNADDWPSGEIVLIDRAITVAVALRATLAYYLNPNHASHSEVATMRRPQGASYSIQARFLSFVFRFSRTPHARPGFAPVCSPFLMTCTPFTNTCFIPVAY